TIKYMNKPNNQNRRKPSSNKNGQKPRQSNGNSGSGAPVRASSRGAAIRAQRRTHDDAQRLISQYLEQPAIKPEERPRANKIDDKPRLKIIGLGGMDGGGSK